MPRSLVSYWKRVATSGPTTDGRDILPQELRDIAETYKPSLYTAVIWSEHDRSQGSYGTVFAVRLLEEGEDLEPGQVALEAQLKPNDRLLELNDQGQKLFSSIEIYPNFRGKGKSYMTGLAVTDEPASIGTQELYFSRKTSERTYYAASVELVHAHHDSANSDEKGLIKALTTFFKNFATETPPAETTPPQTENKSQMDEANGTALKALRDQLLIIVAGIDVVIDSAAADTPDPEPELIEDVQAAVDDIVTTAEEEREFKRKGSSSNKAVLTALLKLQKQFSTLQNTAVGRQLPRNPGPVNTPKKRVF
ncbi:GPO family capsid scaffolding protein [Pseudomonas weihenstephanensis]|uniref:GPO family capsid scaffolding protein n=1 Tax=Pseudomonas weihenstephanensis TaxID=1608994 RepID=UPI00193B8A77|nr:GPO family capsid scaffolding protein [Pseudomonas weihenstephanensis]MBM1190153.1 capsid scaffolding protein [Pseudomonas weihenstephanensis]